MISRCWIAAFALGLVISGGGLSQESPVNEQSDAQLQANQNERESAPPGLPVRILEVPEKSQADQRSDEDSRQREIEDLLAQQSMAQSTEQIVFWTKLQFVLALVGTFALVYSLHLNRRATNAAIETIRLERAWMTPGETSCGDFRDGLLNGEPVKNGMMFRVAFMNTGRSPAANCQIWLELVIVGRDDPIPDFSAPKAPNELGGGSVPAGLGLGNHSVIGDEDAEAFRSGEKDVVIFSGAHYHDIFSDQSIKSWRETAQTVRAVHHGGWIETPQGRAPHITFQSLGKFNYTK